MIALWGEGVLALLERQFLPATTTPLALFPVDRLFFGRYRSLTDAEEDLVLVRLGNDRWELYCHGGPGAVRAIVATIASAGGEETSAADWLRQHHQDPLSVAAQRALMQATTEQAALILLRQAQGALRRELLRIEALLAEESSEAASALQHLRNSYAWGKFLTEPYQVVLCGPPNVGKSSLINALVGYERAIVQDQPGTTRDVVTTYCVVNGWSVALSDTAGLRSSPDPLESEGIFRANARMEQADLLIVVGTSDQSAANLAHFQVRPQQRLLWVQNKIDLAPPSTTALQARSLSPLGTEANPLPVSAITGQGLAELRSALSEALDGQCEQQGPVLFARHQFQIVTQAVEFLRQEQSAEAIEILQGLRTGNFTAPSSVEAD